MSSPQESKSTNSSNEIISLEELSFVSAMFFVIGAMISFYVAYKRLKDSSLGGPPILQPVP
ncbi:MULTISPECIES: hypothetical protein [Oceanobacillus]|uniref:Uncharacterized protein n=2 Tax=Oceanobacillus TaxID=182709 RepID=A0A917XS17_9BACI|nr:MULTISPECIES: hypothetical protein [Oceanobacillus]GGN51169.1 hypothetical protein GCM10007971_05460 [Oceanobacillus indicireducens]